MHLDAETLRFIFGFKLRGMRQEKDLSLKTLAQLTGLSPSYINEIEKGKKYPKSDKILLLAQALGVSYDELTSIKLKRELGIIAQVLGNNMVRGLPFDIFGIPSRTLFELMAERPQNFSALVGTILELARNHHIRVEDLFHAALRAYLDSNNNYFDDLEKSASKFRKKLSRSNVSINGLKEYLIEENKYLIESSDFSSLDPALKGLHSYFVPGDRPKLYLSHLLTEREKHFTLAKEAGFCFLEIQERLTSNLQKEIDSFDEVLNNFRAAYFASALLIPKDQFIDEIKSFLNKEKWSEETFLNWIQKYPSPPSAFFHRLSQIIPQYFDLEQMFFLKFYFDSAQGSYHLLRELHLTELHAPHDLRDQGHYCRRWVTLNLLKEMSQSPSPLRVGIQRSKFFAVDKEYICFSVAYPRELHPNQTECVTIGIKIDAELGKRIRFLNDPGIPKRIVGDTCGKCEILDCEVRAAPFNSPNEPSVDRDLKLALSKLGS